MTIRAIALTSLITATGAIALTAGADDDYVGGTAVVLLTDEFVQPLGANVLAANLPFPGNPFTPMMGGGAVPLYDAASLLGGAPVPTNQVMSAERTANEDGTVTITVNAQTQDGAAFVTASTPTTVLTLKGPQEANEFVLDFGNGYENPAFPVNGALGCGGSAGTIDVIQGVVYYFTRLDGTENIEVGDAPVVIREDGSMTFAWGFDIEDAKNFNRCGFSVTFTPTPEPEPECPADLDGDGTVGPQDLTIVLGAWNTPEADLDGDGNTGPQDLTIVLGAWGGDGCGGEGEGLPNDPSGACCLACSSCITTTQSNCQQQFGIFYQGKVCYQGFVCPGS